MMEERNNAARATTEADPAAEQINGAQPRMQITINLFEGNEIQVNGPLENEMLFDWMLKKAGEAATNYRVKQAAERAREAAKPTTLLGHLKKLAPVRKH